MMGAGLEARSESIRQLALAHLADEERQQPMDELLVLPREPIVLPDIEFHWRPLQTRESQSRLLVALSGVSGLLAAVVAALAATILI